MIIRLRGLLARTPFLLVMMFAAITVAGPVMMASPAHADLCSEVPVPANPWDDDLSQVFRPALNDDGNIASEQPNTAFGADRDTTLAKMYGVDYTFFAYDASCNWGTDSLFTFAASGDTKLFKIATYPFAFAFVATTVAMSPGWRNSLDSSVQDVVGALGENVFNALAGLVITAAAVVAFMAARQGDVSRAFTQVMWIAGLIGVAAVSITNPSVLTSTVDDAVIAVVDTAGSAVPNTDEEKKDATAEENVVSNLEAINEDVYYRAWLQAQLGSADGVAAKNYGATLFDATHLTWWEGKTVKNDPLGEGQKVIDRKQQAFKDTVDKIEDEDPAAFEYMKGRNVNRTGTTTSAILQAWLALPFYIVAMTAVGVALLTIRIAVMLLPMLVLAGMFEPSRAWLLSILQKYSGNIVKAPVTFVCALVNIYVVGAVFNGGMPIFGKILVCVITMIVLWTIARPQMTPMPLMRTGMRWGRNIAGMFMAKKMLDSKNAKKSDGADNDSQAPSQGPNGPAGTPGGGGRGQRPVASASRSAEVATVGAPPVREPINTTVRRVPNTSDAPGTVPVRRHHGIEAPASRQHHGTEAPESRQIEGARVPDPQGAPAAGNTGRVPSGEAPEPRTGSTVTTTWVTPAHQGTPENPWVTPAPGTEKPKTAHEGDAERGTGGRAWSGGTPPREESPNRTAAPEDSPAGKWESGYERVELRREDAPSSSGALQGDAIFIPRSSGRDRSYSEGVSEGNTTVRGGEKTFEVWSPRPASSGTETKPGTGRAA